MMPFKSDSLFEELDDLYLNETYNEYLSDHIANVQRGYDWLVQHLPKVIYVDDCADKVQKNITAHDASKYTSDEFYQYAQYFYGKGKKDKQTRIDFQYAWNHHQKHNPHHWQYWVYLTDDKGSREPFCLDMPYEYIIEMICDHWSFSWKSNNLYEIFKWYDKNKKNILFSEKTRKTYEDILKQMKEKLDLLEHSEVEDAE